jgi:transposase InsO family protein
LTAYSNSYSERWVLSIKSEFLSNLILIGERSLENAVTQFVEHYHHERNHQGLDNVIPFLEKEQDEMKSGSGTVHRRDRLGGLLKYYYREVA